MKRKLKFCFECDIPPPVRFFNKRTCTSVLSPCVSSSCDVLRWLCRPVGRWSNRVLKGRNRYKSQRWLYAKGSVYTHALLLFYHVESCKVFLGVSQALRFLNKRELSFWCQPLLLKITLNTYTSFPLLALNYVLIWHLINMICFNSFLSVIYFHWLPYRC